MVAALGLGLGLAACGATPKLTPTLSISSPDNNATVNVSGTNKVAVNFSTNYVLKTAGQCAGVEACGHIFLLVDSSACNGAGTQYNTLVLSSPAQADLGKCAKVAGAHVISLELRADDGSVVRDLLDNPVDASVTINAQL